jgi:hypothetical protein
MPLARLTLAARRTTVATRLLVLVVLVAGAVFGYRRLHPRERSTAARGGKLLHVALAGPEPHYLQHDPRWAGDTLGTTRETLGAVGCLVCSLAMGSEALGAPVDPGELNRRLTASQGYTPEARVIWAKVPGATGGAVEVAVHAQPEHAVLDTALERGELSVIRFTLPSGAPHWVLVVGKEGDEYLVKDPLVAEAVIVKLTSRTSSIESVRTLRRAAASLRAE